MSCAATRRDRLRRRPLTRAVSYLAQARSLHITTDFIHRGGGGKGAAATIWGPIQSFRSRFLGVGVRPHFAILHRSPENLGHAPTVECAAQCGTARRGRTDYE